MRLRNVDGFKFRRQHVLGDFVVDFVCLNSKLVIEIDGGQHAEATEYDELRSAWIEKEGFRVLRYWNSEVLENPDGVLETIWGALRDSPPPC